MQGAARRGLSIGELVVATGLLALMVVTVMVLFGQMLNSTTKNALVAQGTFFAESVIEREIYRLQDTAGTTAITYSQDWISVTDEANKTQFLYRVESTPVPEVGQPEMGGCYSINVEVRWWTEDMQGEAKTRHGFGKMYLKRSRLVYVPVP
jgi:hypothetical protein